MTTPRPPSTPPDDGGTPFGVEHRREPGGGVRMCITGCLDVAGAPVFRRELGRAARRHATVVIDLSQLEFVDSTGLHALVCANHDAQAEGWRLRLIAAADGVQRVFRMTDLVRALPFVPPEGAAGAEPGADGDGDGSR